MRALLRCVLCVRSSAADPLSFGRARTVACTHQTDLRNSAYARNSVSQTFDRCCEQEYTKDGSIFKINLTLCIILLKHLELRFTFYIKYCAEEELLSVAFRGVFKFEKRCARASKGSRLLVQIAPLSIKFGGESS